MSGQDEQISTSEVARLLGLRSAAAARVQLVTRWRLEAIGRDTATGEKLWPRAVVEALASSRPGRGARTDIRRHGHAHRQTGPDRDG